MAWCPPAVPIESSDPTLHQVRRRVTLRRALNAVEAVDPLALREQHRSFEHSGEDLPPRMKSGWAAAGGDPRRGHRR